MIDLHMHTTMSDGAHTPAALLQQCEALGLELISITDHNDMRAYAQFKDPAIRGLFSGEILPGCEFGVQQNQQMFEILGYGIDPEAAQQQLSARYLPLTERRRRELPELTAYYRQKGFTLNEENLPKTFDPTAVPKFVLWAEINRYPENRRLYTDPGSQNDPKTFARREIANPNSPYFLDPSALFPSGKEICRLIHALGGKAIIAHPGCYNALFYDHLDALIGEIQPDGLEVWYASHTPEQREYLLSLCQKHHLIYSGGSDYHNQRREEKYGHTLGLPALQDIFPAAEIRGWADTLRKI